MFVTKTRFFLLIIVSLSLMGCREAMKKDALAPEITKQPELRLRGVFRKV